MFVAPARFESGAARKPGHFDPRFPPLCAALILIVICGHPPPIVLLLHANFAGDRILLLFTIAALDFAGEFRREGAKNNATDVGGAIDILLICANPG